MPVLRIKLPNQGEVTHILSGEHISIGRRPDNTIQILDRSVSGHHAELISVNGHYRLHDLQSTNLCFVDGQPVRNAWKTAAQVPASTAVSDALSKDLKRRGFNFVGTTICYAFMQAVGMVNDHTVDCFRWKALTRLA